MTAHHFILKSDADAKAHRAFVRGIILGAAHGWHWQSQTDAARDLGVIATTVSWALKRGTFDKLVKRRLGTNPRQREGLRCILPVGTASAATAPGLSLGRAAFPAGNHNQPGETQ